MTDWSQCPVVESVPGKVSGAWVFKGTRLPVHALFENLAEGATIYDFIEWFGGVKESEVKAALEHVAQELRAKAPHACSPITPFDRAITPERTRRTASTKGA